MNNITEKDKSDEKRAVRKTPRATPCESCAYYDEIDEDGTLGCVVDIDQDELYRERNDFRGGCPYYKFYNEYKSVQKQN